MAHVLTIATLISFPFILISVMYSQASKVWASQRAAHEVNTHNTDPTNTDADDDNCPLQLIGQNEAGDLVWPEWFFESCTLAECPPQPGRCEGGNV